MGSSRSWIALAESVGSYLADQPDDDTVTFLLGAGASRSSGAPSTPEVLDALTEQHPDEFPDSKVSEGMDAISDSQVRVSIKPLFEGLSPHVGYLSLAALATSTRVLVVNLNWDSAVEQACERVGVRCASIVLDERNALEASLKEIEDSLADPGYRVVNLHLHGLLDAGNIRLAPKKTNAFERKTIELLWSSFFVHPTVVAGATLTGERDVTSLLTASSQGPAPKESPFWLFSRQPERTELPEDRVATELLSRNESELNFRGHPFIDFDRIMVEILAKRIGRPLKDVFVGTSLPQIGGEKLVFPAPKLLRDHLERPAGGRFLALVGERRCGKSSTAKLLAHWTGLRAKEPIQVISAEGAARCAQKATDLLTGSLTPGAGDVVIFDDPFGASHSGGDRAFVTDLCAIAGIPGAPQVIVTASLSAWHTAVAAHPELDRQAEAIVASPTEWYEGMDLAASLDEKGSAWPAMATRRALEGFASTPERVSAAATATCPAGEQQVIEDKLRLLGQLGEDTQRFLAMVRFHELSRTVIPRTELVQALHEATHDIPTTLKPMLAKSELSEEGEAPYLFAHHTDRAAFDMLYREKQEDLRPSVFEAAYDRSAVADVCEIWQLVVDLRNDRLERVAEMAAGGEPGRRKLLEWGPLILQEAANSMASRPRLEQILELLLEIDSERDFWALRELVYEVVRLWPELNESPTAREFLHACLTDRRRMGCYCVLETMLYFQGAIHQQVWERDYVLKRLWNRVTAAVDDLIEDVDAYGDELALIFDAVTWSKPPLAQRELLSWVDPIVNALVKQEHLKGAIALSCLYHPDGVTLFEDLDRPLPLADIGNLTEQQMCKAAAVVRWHYVHQSRGRALLSRRRLEPAYPHLLQREARDKRVPKRQADAIERFVTRMAHFPEHRGWAIHLGFNLRCTAGGFDDRFFERLVADLQECDDGMVTAALTYRIPDGAHAATQRYFRNPPNRERLLDVMLHGCPVESLSPSASVVVCPPRFMSGRSPQWVHMQLDTQWTKALGNIPNVAEQSFPDDVHAILCEAEDAGLVDAPSKWRVMRHVQRGDLRPLDEVRARAPHDPALSAWLRHRSELAEIVVAVALDADSKTLL